MAVHSGLPVGECFGQKAASSTQQRFVFATRMLVAAAPAAAAAVELRHNTVRTPLGSYNALCRVSQSSLSADSEAKPGADPGFGAQPRVSKPRCSQDLRDRIKLRSHDVIQIARLTDHNLSSGCT